MFIRLGGRDGVLQKPPKYTSTDIFILRSIQHVKLH